MPSNIRRQLETWLKTIDVKCDSCLDVGGVVLPVKSRTKSWNVSDYKILDSCSSKRGTTTDYMGDINYPIDELPQFDVVFCLEVMEYIWNPAMALHNISNFLKPNGILYISFHLFFPHHHPSDIDYLRYTRRGIERLLKETGFKVEEIIPRMTIVPDILKKFCEAESKVYKHQGEIGYLIKAKKHA